MSEDGCVCRLRGLPWSATPDEVIEFFGDAVHIVPEGVAFTYSREGRPSGEAFVELESEEDVEAALTMHKKHMGQRYIEVFRSKQSEMEWVVKRAGKNQNSQGEAIVRLRGLPFGCSKEEIAQFFSGLEIVPNGIMLPEDRQGRGTGEAYVQFSSSEIAERALLKHKERIGHRYIEIFKSSLDEASAFMTPPSRPRPLMGNMGPTRPTPYARDNRGFMGGSMGGMGMSGGGGGGGGAGGSMYGRGRGGRNLKGYYDDDFDDGMGMGGGGGSMGMGRRGGNMRQQQRGLGGASSMGGGGGGFGGMGGGSRFSMQHSVHMRGLPFQANQRDIQDFFAPLDPKGVELKYNDQGRPTGEADVEFMSHQDAVEAMKKHKANMQHRYIELFLNSTPGGRGHGDGFGGDDFDGDGDMGMMDMNSRGMRRGILSLFSPKVKFDPACKGQPPSLLGGGDGMGGGYGGGNMGMDGGGFGGMGKNPNYTAF